MKSLILLTFLTLNLIADQCPTINQINNTYTPLDLYKKMPECFKKERYDDAAKLYLIAQAYGKYDTERVSDRSAHQATAVLRMSIGSMLNETQREKFQTSLSPMLEDRTKICNILKTLGKPNYHPDYMINHGLKAFNGPQLNGGINTDFAPDIAWDHTLNDYFNCTKK